MTAARKPAATPRPLDAEDVAEALKVSRSRAYEIMREIVGPGAALRIDDEAFDRYLQSITIVPPGIPPLALPRVVRGDSVVYFVRANTGPVKIGWTKDLPTRLGRLQIGNPRRLFVLAAIKGNLWDEENLHERFAHLRLRGEWFKSARELLDYIDSLSVPS